jgi:hypothetical protein
MVGAVRVCWEPMEEVSRESQGERWCFKCRSRRKFFYVVTAPTDPMSYYGPNPSVRCGTCDLPDGDLFPGREREWDE